jgi:uroporphyrinogen-III synthase
LAGREIVVTQARRQAPELGALLAAEGATPLYYPCIAIEPPASVQALDAALRALAAGEYTWLVLTSANTVQMIAARLQQMGIAPEVLAGVKLAAIGAATDEALAESLGRRAELLPGESKAEGLAAAIKEIVGRGEKLLLPQADIARPVLLKTLTAAGLEVTPVVAYRTTGGSGGIDLSAQLRTWQSDGDAVRAHAVTFTSPSTVHNLIGRLLQEGGNPIDLRHVVRACIGPVTAEALKVAGLPPDIVAPEQSLEGLVTALCKYDWNRP